MLRIVLFLATNMAILILLGIVMSLLGIDSRSTSGLLLIAGMFGMGGSLISLAMSKWIAKKSTGAQDHFSMQASSRYSTEPKSPC